MPVETRKLFCDCVPDLSKRGEASQMTKGNARAEEIRRERAIHIRAENVSVVIAAEISDAAEPTGGIVNIRCVDFLQKTWREILVFTSRHFPCNDSFL